jgi:aspartyl protease family protein
VALSLSGRKLVVEVVGSLAALVAGVVIVTHRQQTLALFGIQLPAQTATIEATPKSVESITPSTRRGRNVELRAGDNGHFFTQIGVDGAMIDVIVDTGASIVALTYDDARRAGLLPLDREFTGRVQTANGIARVAPVEIGRITIGDIEVRSVRGVVAEEGAMRQSLLGMTFLSRLSNVSMQSGRLVLEE